MDAFDHETRDLDRLGEALRNAQGKPSGAELDRVWQRTLNRAAGRRSPWQLFSLRRLNPMKPRFLVPLLLTVGLLATSAGLGLTGSAISEGGFDASSLDLAQDNGSAGAGGGGGGGGGDVDEDDVDGTGAGGGVGVGDGNGTGDGVGFDGGSGGGGDGSGDGFAEGTGDGSGDGTGDGLLADTGLVALPLLIGGLALLGAGLVLRRRSSG